MKYIISLLLLTSTSLSFAQFRVVGYLPTWSTLFSDNLPGLDLSRLTHMDISFANPNVSGDLILDEGTVADMDEVITTAHAADLKVYISIGGGSASGTNYENLLDNNQTTFVTKIVNYTVSHNFDGVDVDIEGNILDGTILTAAQYESFVSELDLALAAENKEMSCAIGTWFGSFVTNTAASKFDFINIMSYDATGPWDPNNGGQHSPYSMAVSDFEYWNVTKGVPGDKLTIGVPFYGYGFGTYANQGMSYCDIVTTYPGAENSDQVGTGQNAIYYNGIPTIEAKTLYALEHAGGIMMWELSEDCTDELSLLGVIDSVIQANTLGLDLLSNEFSSSVYPNPAREVLNFSSQFEGSMSYDLKDLKGSIIKSGSLESSEGKQIDVSVLEAGIYLLELKNNNLQKNLKITIAN